MMSVFTKLNKSLGDNKKPERVCCGQSCQRSNCTLLLTDNFVECVRWASLGDGFVQITLAHARTALVDDAEKLAVERLQFVKFLPFRCYQAARGISAF